MDAALEALSLSAFGCGMAVVLAPPSPTPSSFHSDVEVDAQGARVPLLRQIQQVSLCRRAAPLSHGRPVLSLCQVC
jgi:hypothetical protein